MFTLSVEISPREIRIGSGMETVERLIAAEFHSRLIEKQIVTAFALGGPPVDSDLIWQTVEKILSVAGATAVWLLRSLTITASGKLLTAEATLATGDTDHSELTIVSFPAKKLVSLHTEGYNYPDVSQAVAAFQAAAEQFMIAMALHRQAGHIRDFTDSPDVAANLDAMDSLIPLSMPHIASHWKLLMSQVRDWH